ELAWPVYHDPIGPHVDPTVLGVACDHAAAGSDVATSVSFVPERSWIRRHIDLVAAQHLLQHRSAANDSWGKLRRSRAPFGRFALQSANEIMVAESGIEADRGRKASGTRERAGENPATTLESRNLGEK